MIFTRKSDAALASLVKQLDEAVAANADKDLKAFVNLLGTDRDALEAEAKKISSENVPIVVPVEFENGPDNFGINPDAETTVMLYVKSTVVANHALGAKGLNKKAIAAVMADVPKILE